MCIFFPVQFTHLWLKGGCSRVQYATSRKLGYHLSTSIPWRSPYLDDALAGGQWQPHQTGVIDGHNLVPHAKFSRASCRATVQHAGQNDSGQNGPPARLYYYHTKDLPFLLFHIQLGTREKGRPHFEFQIEDLFLLIQQSASTVCLQWNKKKSHTSLQLSEFEKWTRSSWYISWELMMSLYCFWLKSVGLMPLARRNSL